MPIGVAIDGPRVVFERWAVLKLALTFDDLNAFVPRALVEDLLDLLIDTGVHGTLFVIPGNPSDRDSPQKCVDLLVRANMSGHEIGLHGYGHEKNEFGFLVPVPLPSVEVQRELLRKGRECLRNEIGESPVGFRAPNYRHSRLTLQALEKSGLQI